MAELVLLLRGERGARAATWARSVHPDAHNTHVWGSDTHIDLVTASTLKLKSIFIGQMQVIAIASCHL